MLDGLHLQIKQFGKLAGQGLPTLFVAIFHFPDGLDVRHVADNTGELLQPGQLTATVTAVARHNLIAVAVFFRSDGGGGHNAMFLDRPHQFGHFFIVLYLERVIPESVKRMELRKFQIDQLSLVNGTGWGGWLRWSLFRGLGGIFGWDFFGFRGSFDLRSLFPTSGHFVSLSRRGLAGGRLIRLGWAALAGLRRLLASRLRFFLFWRTAPAGLFRFAIPCGGRFLLCFLLRLFCRLLFFYLGPGCLPLFIHQLIDFVKGHYHITGFGLDRPLLLRCGSGGLFGSRSLGPVSRNRSRSLRELLLTGACVQFFICHSLSSFL